MDQQKDQQKEQHGGATPNLARRAFFRGAGGLGVLAAAAASGAAGAAAPPAGAALPPVSKGYRVTEHIRKYYSTARYW